MKKRWLILLIIFLAGLFFYFEQLHNVPTFVDSTPCPAYQVTIGEAEHAYNTYNLTEFNGSLPTDTVINFNEVAEDNMATTNLLPDGRFKISFNREYVVGVRVMNMTMLHEMCHIKTWGNEHNDRWQACMLDLDKDGAFREIIIDGYEEPRFLVNGKKEKP